MTLAKFEIIDFYRLLLINRQISSIIEYYRLIDYVFDDRFRLICNVMYQESENLTNNSTTTLIVSSLLEYTFVLPSPGLIPCCPKPHP